MYRKKSKSRSKANARSKPKSQSIGRRGVMPQEHCESDEDGVRRCEPEEQYRERMATPKGRSQRSRRSLSSVNASRSTTSSLKDNSSVLKHIVKQASRRNGRKHGVAVKVDDWLIHQDVAEPLEQFSSLRFSDTGATQKTFGRRPHTVESDTIGTHYNVKYVDDDVSDGSSSSGDYSSSEGTSEGTDEETSDVDE